MGLHPPNDRKPADLEAFAALVYDDLREVARRYFRRQPPGFTLRPTDIVHEACLHLIAHGRAEWTSTQHFRAIAARKMWQIVVDHLKHRYAQKRGGAPPRNTQQPPMELVDSGTPRGRPWRRVPLENVAIEWRDRDVDLLDLADALNELDRESHRLNDVVTLHWFGGLTYQEVAQHLGISTSTAEKDFRYALAWLNRRLERDAPDVH
ncbi:MAG: sigma-70 family RNA polymerase sigma factor [Planctomycetota bacterium]